VKRNPCPALLSVAALAFLLTPCGCTVISELPPEALQKENDSPEFLQCRKLLIAFLKDDASGFVNALAPELRDKFPEEKFKLTRAQLVKQLGEPVSFRYITTLEMTALKPNLWAVRFKKTNQQSGKEFHQEVVFRAVTARVDGRANIISFNFQ